MPRRRPDRDPSFGHLVHRGQKKGLWFQGYAWLRNDSITIMAEAAVPRALIQSSHLQVYFHQNKLQASRGERRELTSIGRDLSSWNRPRGQPRAGRLAGPSGFPRHQRRSGGPASCYAANVFSRGASPNSDAILFTPDLAPVF
jgi:hypothetical protein